MRKLLSLFLALVATTTLWAYDFEVDGIYYDYLDGNNVEVTFCTSYFTSCDEYSGKVIIPSTVTYNGTTYNVTRIRDYAFSHCTSLTSVTIPNSVTSIGDDAFCGCSSLTSVTIGNSVTSIGDDAFCGCSSLTSVTIPNSVTSIEHGAFSGCKSLTSVTIPNSVTSIGRSAFYGCESLTSVTIPNSVTSIGETAFANCSSLTSVTIPNSVTSIGEKAFYRCFSLTSITIPNSVTTIGNEAFYDCDGLTSVTLGNSVTSIGNRAFWDCSSLRSVTLGNSVTSIGEWAFADCSLTSVTIPNSVTTIGSHAFWCCYSLTSITIGNGVTTIGEAAFTSVYNHEIEEIYCYPTLPPVVESQNFSSYHNTTLYVPCDSKEAYEEHPVFGKFKKIRGIDGCGEYVTTHIYDTICQGEVYEFRGCLYDATGTYTSTIDLIPTYLYLTVLPSPTVTITVEANNSYIWHDEVYTESGEYKYVTVAANGCDSTEVLLLTIISSDEDEPNSPNKIYYTSSDGNIVTPFAKGVFGAKIISNTYEKGQGVITFDGPVTSIGDYAFADCSSLTSVTIPNSVTSIGYQAFWECTSLTSVTIPNSVTSIGDGAFKSTALYNDTANWENGALFIDDCLIEAKKSISGAYTIKENTRVISDDAFDFCSSLTSVTIPNSVTSIGWSAFSGCTSLTSMVVASGNSTYDSRDNCNAIIETATNTLIAGCQNTTIPTSVTSIGLWAFSLCESLTSITIPNSVTSIGYQAFYGCSSLTFVTIPNSVTSIGNYAFVGCSSLTSVTIPNSVTSIGRYAFYDCSSLDTLTCLAMTPPALGNSSVFNGCDNPTLYVPCEALPDYQAHEQWGQFTTIECISSEETDTEDVIIESGTTTVIITWPTEEGADTYTIVIKKDGEVVCTLTFNSEGQLLNIAFAPGRDGNHPAQYAEQAGKGYRFTVTGLEEGTHYTYNIDVKNIANQTIKSHSGEFTTQSTTAVDNITTKNANIQKIIRDGQFIILRDGVEYNAMGQKM